MRACTGVVTFAVVILFLCSAAFGADEDRTPTSRPAPMVAPQEGYSPEPDGAPAFPAYLEEALKAAIENGNASEQRRIEMLMKAYVPSEPGGPISTEPDIQVRADMLKATAPDWSGADIRVHAGDVKTGRYRHLDLKKGEDGNLYLAVNRRNVTGYTGWTSVYKSTNGGASWTFVSGIASTTAYFGEVSMLVEVRSASNYDSTRVILFYTRSANSNMDGAAMRYASFLRDGTAFLGGASDILVPAAGRQFGSPSAISDGAYWTVATYLGVVFAEYNNAEDSCKSIRFYRTTNWGDSFTGASITSSYQDFYPSAALKPGASSGGDSVYIAVERRFKPTNSLVRVIATTWAPSTGDRTYYLPSVDTSAQYRKPFINVRQTGRAYGTDRDVLITVSKNGAGYYHLSANGGGSWNLDYNLASNVTVAYTFCASDSLTSGGGYFIAAYVDASGDTVGVRRGVLGSLGTRVTRNSHRASTSVLPACGIYLEGPSKIKRSAYAYAGFGPTDVWFNQEGLPVTSVEPLEGVAQEYRLEQNYPNPFNPATTIAFEVPDRVAVSLKVFDIMGREVETLVDKMMDAGRYSATFDASRLSTGVYLYRMSAGNTTMIRKMVLTK